VGVSVGICVGLCNVAVVVALLGSSFRLVRMSVYEVRLGNVAPSVVAVRRHHRNGEAAGPVGRAAGFGFCARVVAPGPHLSQISDRPVEMQVPRAK
jgi:hypothetical protein